MSWKLFLDDERHPIDETYVIARSSTEAIQLSEQNGLPCDIAFDHDLGGTDTAIHYINWLVDYLLDNEKTLPQNFKYSIHSQNPVGCQNIEGWMETIIMRFGVFNGEQ